MHDDHSNAAASRRVSFVILSNQRSGSTLLCELLGFHPDVEISKELFKLSGNGRNLDDNRYDPNKGCVEDFLGKFFRYCSHAVKAKGFKLMLDQLKANHGLEEYLAEERISVVYLERENLLKQHVSRQSARSSHLYHAEEAVPHQTLFLSTNSLLEHLEQLESERKELRRLASGYGALSITYEELVQDREATLGKIQDFLRIEPRVGLTSPLVKILPMDLNQSLANYPQIYSLISETRFCGFLDPLLQAHTGDRVESIFIHIPKAAGTSIEAALYGTFGKVGHKTAFERRRLDPEAFDRSFKFAFVRNPYDRFISAFAYMRKGGRNRIDRQWAEKNLACYKDFESFVFALQEPQVAKTVMSWMHFRPQNEFLYNGGGKLMVDFLGRYETLDEDFMKVSVKLGKQVSLPHLNSVERGYSEFYYTDVTREIVGDLYAKDFELFEYEI